MFLLYYDQVSLYHFLAFLISISYPSLTCSFSHLPCEIDPLTFHSLALGTYLEPCICKGFLAVSRF